MVIRQFCNGIYVGRLLEQRRSSGKRGLDDSECLPLSLFLLFLTFIVEQATKASWLAEARISAGITFTGYSLGVLSN